MELVLCMTPIFRLVPHFLCPTDTFVFYLHLLTVNLIIHNVRGYLEKSPIAVLKLTTVGLLYFNVTTWSYSLPVKLLNFSCNGNCRVVTIVSDHRTVGLKSCRTITTHPFSRSRVSLPLLHTLLSLRHNIP